MCYNVKRRHLEDMELASSCRFGRHDTDSVARLARERANIE